MARIIPRDFPKADYGKFENISGDYFVKTLLGDSNGDFVDSENPLPTKETGLILTAWNSFEVTQYTSDECIEIIEFYYDSVLKFTTTLTYNVNGNIQGGSSVLAP